VVCFKVLLPISCVSLDHPGGEQSPRLTQTALDGMEFGCAGASRLVWSMPRFVARLVRSFCGMGEWSCDGEKQLNEWGTLRGEQLSPHQDPCPVPWPWHFTPTVSAVGLPVFRRWSGIRALAPPGDIAEVSSLSTGTNNLGANTRLPREPYPVLSSIPCSVGQCDRCLLSPSTGQLTSAPRATPRSASSVPQRRCSPLSR
jgi:hypothetical protein